MNRLKKEVREAVRAIGGEVAAKESSFGWDLRSLQVKFSTGVRVTELKSIAMVLAMLANVSRPTREMNRHHGQLMQWYQDHWSEIAPFLPLVQLRDEKGIPIDGQRELVERKLIRLVSGE